jgi:hypothetical protein
MHGADEQHRFRTARPGDFQVLRAGDEILAEHGQTGLTHHAPQQVQ